MNEYPAQAVSRFAADWESTLRGDRREPPHLNHYVPDGAALQLDVLTALVRVDMRQRWRRAGLEKRIAEYRSEFPAVTDSPEFADLVCEEYLVRSRYRALDVDTFSTEYPEVAGEIRRRFADGAVRAETPALPAGIETGRRLDDFDLLTDLGGATHSRMFLARQRSMQRLVAVRVEAGADSDTPTVAQLDHHYIVRVYDQRLIAGNGGDSKPLRLLYMQYMPGGNAEGVLTLLRESHSTTTTPPPGGALLLRAVDAAMEARGEIRPAESSVRQEITALSWPETVAWVGRRLAVALDYAERHGVQHHDIRPANVLFTAEGVPKLADFALGALYWNAGIPGAGGAAADAPEELRWRSPEALAARLDPTAPMPDTRSDIWSLGVLLWEMLTGTAPFDDPPATGVPGHEVVTAMLARRRLGVPPAALNALPADTPAALRRVLLECLHPDPERRRQNGTELAGQLDLCLNARARDLVDPPPKSWRARARRWPVPIVALCVGVPNAIASFYNIRLNQSLIVDRLAAADQQRFGTVALVNNAIAFPLAALLLLWLARRPLTVSYRLAHGHRYPPAELARARADTLLMAERAVWIPFIMWMIAGVAWPLALYGSGARLPPHVFAHFFAAQTVCAAIALAYPFFLVAVYSVRVLYPQLLVRGAVGPADRRGLWALARRSNVYLAVAASVPLLGVATATFVSREDLALVIVPVRWLSVGGVLAFVLSYWLFRLLEADLRALLRAIPSGR
ncbi:protein kinase [Nocardia sp. SYP-A9097]|uniref:serine/threonine protein kinase n=1 Tax=Nocardia sp. SYP-A9097 TaxID=2663237 RepID=UPI00129B4927|nr:protein kinase [Nocardia sp. SYP-A9097]MRH90442.1 protein kinase [Nocardia sp. SYP-A9097]